MRAAHKAVWDARSRDLERSVRAVTEIGEFGEQPGAHNQDAVIEALMSHGKIGHVGEIVPCDPTPYVTTEQPVALTELPILPGTTSHPIPPVLKADQAALDKWLKALERENERKKKKGGK